MTALVSVEDLAGRLKLGDTVPDGIETLLLQILDDTTLVLSELLRTDFDRATRSDIFELDSRRFKPFVGKDPHLRTKQGFIDSGQTFEIYSALTLQELTTGPTDDLSGVLVDHEKGRVVLGSSNYIGVVDRKLWPQEWDGHYVQINYTAGFTESGGVYSGVPSWLQSIALTVAAETYRVDSSCDAKGSCAKTCAERLAKYVSRIESKIRFMPSCYDPIL